MHIAHNKDKYYLSISAWSQTCVIQLIIHSIYYMLGLKSFLQYFNFVVEFQKHKLVLVGAFSGRIGLPPAVMGWAASCDSGSVSK